MNVLVHVDVIGTNCHFALKSAAPRSEKRSRQRLHSSKNRIRAHCSQLTRTFAALDVVSVEAVSFIWQPRQIPFSSGTTAGAFLSNIRSYRKSKSGSTF